MQDEKGMRLKHGRLLIDVISKPRGNPETGNAGLKTVDLSAKSDQTSRIKQIDGVSADCLD